MILTGVAWGLRITAFLEVTVLNEVLPVEKFMMFKLITVKLFLVADSWVVSEQRRKSHSMFAFFLGSGFPSKWSQEGNGSIRKVFYSRVLSLASAAKRNTGGNLCHMEYMSTFINVFPDLTLHCVSTERNPWNLAELPWLFLRERDQSVPDELQRTILRPFAKYRISTL